MKEKSEERKENGKKQTADLSLVRVDTWPLLLLSSIPSLIFHPFTLSLPLSTEHLSTSAETVSSWSTSMVGVGRRFIHNPLFESLSLSAPADKPPSLLSLSGERRARWTEHSSYFLQHECQKNLFNSVNLENKHLLLKQQQIYFDANLKMSHHIQKKNKKTDRIVTQIDRN